MRTAGLVVLPFIAAVAACGEGGLSIPRIGYLHGHDGEVRPVAGIRANFLLGEPVLAGVRSAAFSDRFGVVKTDEEILILNAEAGVMERISSASGEALFGFDREGSPAVAYVSSTRTLCSVGVGAQSDCLPLEIDGEVVGLAADDPGTIKLAVRRQDGIWLLSMRQNGRALLAEQLLPGVAAPLLLLPEGALLFVDGGALVIRKDGGAEIRIEAPVQPVALDLMGRNWVRISGGEGKPAWALHLEEQGVEAYCLPHESR